MRPVVIIPAPVEPVSVDLTAWSLAAFFAIGAIGTVCAVTCCLRILNWI